MNTIEKLVIILFVAIFLTIILTYFFHGRKLTKKQKAEKKTETKKTEEVKIEEKQEQKPVPVGIIKEEKVEKNEVYDLAPLKEKEVIKPVEVKQEKQKTIQQEIKDLSPEMKKVLMSDLLKPKF